MTTLYYSHDSFLQHQTGSGHPESPGRLQSIAGILDRPDFALLKRQPTPRGTEQQIRHVHPQAHIDRVLGAIPASGSGYLDGDTVVSPGSGEAALHAVGAACDAVDHVISGQAHNAFCALRPPGHHAESVRAMGFCLFNNIAIAAEYARVHCKLERIAIVDFDVHHGNGTQEIFYRQPNVLYASTHQSPLYPGTGSVNETGAGNIFNAPLPASSGRELLEQAMKQRILPALHRFQPELLLISAGFDAHKDDPLASLRFVEADYAWLTLELMEVADRYCNGRIISMLEGGYNLQALASSTAAHVRQLMTDG